VTIVLRGIKDQPPSNALWTPSRSSLLASDLRGRQPSKKVEFEFVVAVPKISLNPSCATPGPFSLGFTDFAFYFEAGH
jgi:hypothetical protein